jgi:hypothetical protein
MSKYRPIRQELKFLGGVYGSIAVIALGFGAVLPKQPDLSRKYWPIALDSAAVGHWHNHTHVAVTGVVAPRYPIMEADGDLHIKLVAPSGRFIVAECTPKEPCVKPKAGQTITVYGISRQDQEHGWWEVHPVESWK